MATQKTNTKSTSAKTVSTDSEPTRKTDLTTSNQKYAQMINFAELQRILQQNILFVNTLHKKSFLPLARLTKRDKRNIIPLRAKGFRA